MFLVLGAALRGPELGGSGKANPHQGPIRWLWSSLPFRLRSLHDPEPAGFSRLA